MRKTINSLLLLPVLFAAFGNAQSTEAPVAGTGLTGEVTVVQADGQPLKNASQVVVWLAPTDAVKLADASTDKPHYRLQQRNKRFEPGLLVVPVGSVVDFPNSDPWFHNVFSLYRGKRFDLGLYQAGSQRSVRFDRPGPSYLFCNIHPEMTGVVLAVDTDLFGISDRVGRYSIPRVPPGKYLLHVWYENANQEDLQQLQKAVVIDSGSKVLPKFTVTAVKKMNSGHKNKYGQDYDSDALKTEY
jgi:plastocyanin